ncbi:hypothetical protein DPMN_071482 [Dreissena polymorpha]|uniref:Uncharacterized protein n=1 Tax=Dreissena polymorpha TaxID=45954 RepID=A0A9D3Z317_DREPO|nr:hypothetical protein DPMN_071482 [Dreissena polymorpha]
MEGLIVGMFPSMCVRLIGELELGAYPIGFSNLSVQFPSQPIHVHHLRLFPY